MCKCNPSMCFLIYDCFIPALLIMKKVELRIIKRCSLWGGTWLSPASELGMLGYKISVQGDCSSFEVVSVVPAKCKFLPLCTMKKTTGMPIKKCITIGRYVVFILYLYTCVDTVVPDSEDLLFFRNLCLTVNKTVKHKFRKKLFSTLICDVTFIIKSHTPDAITIMICAFCLHRWFYL